MTKLISFASLALILLAGAPEAATNSLFSPVLTDNSQAVLVNPAALGFPRRGDVSLVWNGSATERDFQAAASYGILGVAMQDNPFRRVLALGMGFQAGKRATAGYRISRVSDWTMGGNYTSLDLGGLWRLQRHWALGLQTRDLLTGDRDRRPQAQAGLGFKAGRFTGSCDVSYAHTVLDSVQWNGELGFGPLAVQGRMAMDLANYTMNYFLGISFSFNHQTFSSIAGNDFRPSRVCLELHEDYKESVLPALFRKVAVIEIDGALRDGDPAFSLLGNSRETALAEIISQINKAVKDDDITDLVIKIGDIQASLGMVDEIREAVFYSQLSGKPVWAYLDEVGLLEYYLASAATRVVVMPTGFWNITGVKLEQMYLKGLGDKLGITAQFERIGEYKNAVEPLVSDTMSKETREDETALLKAVYDRLVDKISLGRGVPADTFRAVVDRGYLSLAQAVKMDLVDTLLYFSDLVETMGGANAVAANLRDRQYYGQGWGRQKRVAVILIGGTITMGESIDDFLSGERVTGCNTVVRSLEKAEKDKVDAVVLRINSGGGSAVASDIIWHQVMKVKKAGIPVYASVGGMAASGAYYIACAADKIICNPDAIVGSIGIFTGKFVLKGLYDKLGIKKEVIKFGQNADVYSDYRPFTEYEKQKIQDGMRVFYDGFVQRVADGRKLTLEQVDSVARGRVFTGQRGLEKKLVDAIGGMDLAMEMVRAALKLRDQEMPDVRLYPEETYLSALKQKSGETPAAWMRSATQFFHQINSEHVFAIYPRNLVVE